ncbi:reverse transcriptase domain-containing protein [Tanacetum coccineum]
MVTPVEKRSNNKFCDFHNDKGHSTDECMQLKKQIEELAGKKEVPTKDKPMAIYMIQPWHRVTRQKVTQSFERVSEITFPSLTTSSGTEGPLVIEAEIGGHMIHRIKKGPGPGTCESYPSECTKASKGGNYARILLPRLAVQSSHGLLPLPEIDWNVEFLYGYTFKCFLDAYKGYHQIQMAESDEEKTAFHTSQGVYCYTKMPFDLKNAGTTYQRLVDKDFDSQVGRNIEVYVDDSVIKSHTKAEMLRDIDETFRTLQKINMKLNPKKCTFGAVEGMFLGYMITPKGIKPCPSKTEAVLQLPSSRTIKEVQSLNGKLASLNRFLSKSAEKSLPLFKTLKKCIKKVISIGHQKQNRPSSN